VRINEAARTVEISMLLATAILMAGAVVTINCLVWRKMYGLAETRFKLES
jgi:ABC-type anion transport system duplicated permease subunit